MFENLGRELRKLRYHCDQLMAEWSGMGLEAGEPVVQRTGELQKNVDAIIKQFIQESCVVARQPPVALIKTHAQTIRLPHYNCQPVIRLLGGSDLGYHSDHSSVTCYLISEEQARRLHVNKEAFPTVVKVRVIDEKGQRSGQKRKEKTVILCGAGLLRHQTAQFELTESSYVARFVPSVQLEEIVRPQASERPDSIPQQRYYLCFLVTLFSSTGEQLPAFLKLSLPLAALVHTNQLKEKGAADANFFWEHAFSHGDGILTYVPRENSDGILWPQFAEAVNLKFMQLLEGQKPDEEAVIQPISDLAMNNLAEKIFGFHVDYNDCRVTWEMFFQVSTNGCIFRQWLYKAAELVEKYLLPQWNKGLIMGFASKDRAEALLKDTKKPTLLVKFSDGQIDCLIISYVFPGKAIQHLRLCGKNLALFQSRVDENEMTNMFELALSVRELERIQAVYPDRPMGQLFCSEERRSFNQKQTDPYAGYARSISFGPFVEGAPPAPPTIPDWNVISPPSWMIVDPLMQEDIHENYFNCFQCDVPGVPSSPPDYC